MKSTPVVRWAARVRPEKIRRLYRNDAAGLADTELIDEIGTALYCRCESVTAVSDAASGKVRCPECAQVIDHRDPSVESWLECNECGWRVRWGDYRKTYRHNELFAAGLEDAIEKFQRGWERARDARAKMILIDQLLHAWHWENRDDRQRGRPAAVNFIEGSRAQALALLDELSGNRGSSR